MKSKNPNTEEITILRTAMLFSLTRRMWSNRCMVSNEKLKSEETGEDGSKSDVKLTRRVSATKRLIISKEYDAIWDHLYNVYHWCLNRSMLATGVSKGVYFVRRDMVDEFEAKLAEARADLTDSLVPALRAAYPQAKEDAKRPINDEEPEKGGLGSLYNERDYPTVEKLCASFGIEHSWFALSVPDELPEEVRVREMDKLKKTFADAQQEVLYALREGFQGIISHAIERLHVPAGEKPKVFVADSLVGAFHDFFDTFHAKNLLDDSQLQSVVSQAKEIVKGFSPKIKEVKTNITMRNAIAGQLGQVKSVMDGLLKNRPVRRFNLD